MVCMMIPVWLPLICQFEQALSSYFIAGTFYAVGGGGGSLLELYVELETLVSESCFLTRGKLRELISPYEADHVVTS